MAKEREPAASGMTGSAAKHAAGLFGADTIPGQPSLEESFAALRLLAKSEPAAAAAMQLALETMKIGAGTSAVEPKRSDRRFTDPAWADNPVYRAMAQSYLAWSDAVTGYVEGMQTADWRDKERARFAGILLTSALAPTNFLLGNPAAMQKAFETGGASLVRGFENYLRDLFNNRGMPKQVDASGYRLGENLAVTPGAVVFRNPVCEVIQYQAPGTEARARPLLIVPPPIGKYYFLDLAPGRSLYEYALSRGLRLFTISWRNPTAEQADWGIDTYAEAIVAAVDAVREISGSDDVNAMGFCAGGILLSTVLAHFAALDDTRVHAAALGVTLLDFDIPAALGSLSASAILTAAEAGSSGLGILEAKSLAAVFAWMRPNDLVWNYWVNNYLMGEQPPANDLMAWNADGTNLPAALHAEFLDMFGNNRLAQPGGMNVLGTPVDLGRIGLDLFVMGAVADHLTPWHGCYRATQLFGGDAAFVLSNAGHIAGLVNPPGHAKSRHFVGKRPGPDPDAWLAAATERPGTWWAYWGDWLEARSGALAPAPAALGSVRHPALEPAPGRYIFT